MPDRDPTASALQRLHIAHANYQMACTAKTRTRELLDEAIRHASDVGLSHAEIGRTIGATGQRVGQIVAES